MSLIFKLNVGKGHQSVCLSVCLSLCISVCLSLESSRFEVVRCLDGVGGTGVRDEEELPASSSSVTF